MPRAPLTSEDVLPLSISLVSLKHFLRTACETPDVACLQSTFGIFFACFYNLCGVTEVACWPYEAPWYLIAGAYATGALAGVLLGFVSGSETLGIIDMEVDIEVPSARTRGVEPAVLDALPQCKLSDIREARRPPHLCMR